MPAISAHPAYDRGRPIDPLPPSLLPSVSCTDVRLRRRRCCTVRPTTGGSSTGASKDMSTATSRTELRRIRTAACTGTATSLTLVRRRRLLLSSWPSSASLAALAARAAASATVGERVPNVFESAACHSGDDGETANSWLMPAARSASRAAIAFCTPFTDPRRCRRACGER